MRDLQHLLGPSFAVGQDRRGYPEIQASTLEEVARAGADQLLQSGLAPPFVLEDSGLFVDSLRGFPGVYSRHALDTIGLPGLLRLMAGFVGSARAAHFAACIAYVDSAREVHLFSGRCDGEIASASAGTGGFGFDPIFRPTGGERSFGMMSDDEKAAYSHRGKAAGLLVRHLKSAKT